MNTITDLLFQNPSTFIVLLPLLFIASFIFYITRWPQARPVQFRRADRFRPEKVPSNIDTIVIGSGSGGSTVANLLAQSGQRVLVLEQHSVTGGCTHSFREEGCEWDTGLVSWFLYARPCPQLLELLLCTCIVLNLTLHEIFHAPIALRVKSHGYSYEESRSHHEFHVPRETVIYSFPH